MGLDLEMTRDIAQRFNHHYGHITIPDIVLGRKAQSYLTRWPQDVEDL